MWLISELKSLSGILCNGENYWLLDVQYVTNATCKRVQNYTTCWLAKSIWKYSVNKCLQKSKDQRWHIKDVGDSVDNSVVKNERVYEDLESAK